ncbi:hypothetical protein EJ08DRAFT_717409 [Tothia fuscella]|uniref:Zn(2)-C6 fungal-type domain-containing protein n=1 Tax=Tothia fuscella TaxID=1048955 RepID=A0A9P4NQ37_9PEZI|nr:hypothetical protein EJ08DRAFT_717409 [Tothia fuscella]
MSVSIAGEHHQHGNYPDSPGSDGREEVWSEESGQEGGADADGSRKRKRSGNRPLSVSCETCKQRKVKCDRGHPACSWCQKNNQQCEYRERKKPGLRAGYGRELEAKLGEQAALIEQMKEMLHRHDQVIAQFSSNSILQQSPRALQRELSILKTPSIRGPQHIPRPEAALFLQKSNTYPNQTSFHPDFPISQANPFQSHIATDNNNRPGLSGVQATTRDLYNQPNPAVHSPTLNLPEHHPTTSRSNPSHYQNELPDHDLCYKLVDLFFKHINVWCPILHRKSTIDVLFGSSSLQDEEKVLLHAIITTTLRFCSDTRLVGDIRERQHTLSKEKVQLYGMEHSSVRALQALVIVTLDLVGDSNGPPGWNMLALISRQVVQLGLSVESTSLSIAPIFPSIYTLRAMILPEPKDFIEDESRRRLFWVIYLLDRYATIATAFEFALDDKEIDRRLPCREDFFSNNQSVEARWYKPSEKMDSVIEKPEHLGSFSYYIEVVGILSRIHQFLKKPVDIGAMSDVEHWQKEYRELDSELQTWKYSLPQEYSNMSRVFNPSSKNKVVNCGWIMLHATFYTTIIRLHSSAAYPTTRSPIFTPSYSAAQRCQTAVENISALSTYVKDADMLNQLGPPFAFSIWVAARVLLVHGCTIDHRVSPVIHPLVETLREMGRFWKVADRYVSLLERVLDEYRESEQAPGGETPNAVKILADMRRTAFDLDSLISRQPRMSGVLTNRTTPFPARTPAPADLEYLDVFDFFNLPRLPVNLGGTVTGHTSNHDSSASTRTRIQNELPEVLDNNLNVLNEFNITNFMFDADTDWLGPT